MAHLFFFYFAGIIVLTSILVVALKNPVYSALSLLIMFFHVAGLYVTLHAEFVAAVQIIVYAGAILVLYLFVVMLLNLHREDRYHGQLPVGALLGVTLLTEAVLLLAQRDGVPASTLASGRPPLGDAEGSHGPGGAPAPLPDVGLAPGTVEGNTEAIGDLLYSTYVFPFEVASLILLVAMIGAIILAKRDLFEGQR